MVAMMTGDGPPRGPLYEPRRKQLVVCVSDDESVQEDALSAFLERKLKVD